ncbi:hypothetical protein A2690_01985 [Candidatus Roizmanbacteria bacterium RIFCSPHIGHO2_01_FULL_39_12b]|uniref:Glycosyl transferase family 1 domain-containing protein n=1 Tax=Candidatus Roizmanbacteria bacterium RIFCSPHIGHO2_01_FULL_39_12b TaxID=1802030 RepID=A0A1F7G9L6_9BACT|nr:MAG: hypothetical protein A2690_01985 [Candidatus Roizmanbacteria bacterium RIFCSPHIGHO2_01_FULL_39_12b]
MRIALVAPLLESVPPKKYGGTEWIVYYIAHEMGKRGHTVDLYASGDSKKESGYNLIPLSLKNMRSVEKVMSQNMQESIKTIILSDLVKVISEKNYDIVHNHIGWRFLLFSSFLNSHLLTTHHSLFEYEVQNFAFRHYKNNAFVSISNNQRKGVEDLPFVATIYNGIDESLFPFQPFKRGEHKHMAFLARMNHEKGAIEAAQVAMQTQHELRLGCKVDPVDKKYYQEFKSTIDTKFIKVLGEVGNKDRLNLLSNARCLLAPINWEEPFGLMFIEALACGTPVIAFARGAAPEIVLDGLTGYLVNHSEEMRRGDYVTKAVGVKGLSEAIKKIYLLSDREYSEMRLRCRWHFEKNFTSIKMADGYEAVYKELIKKNKK